MRVLDIQRSSHRLDAATRRWRKRMCDLEDVKKEPP
jgi:hypothetical protein